MSFPGKSRVWIVDDSPLDTEQARRALGDTYEVRLFSDGSAALEVIGAQSQPDVLVLDWVMPGISGIDVCQFLRSHHDGHPEISILLLTSHQQTDQIVAGLSAGANDYLSKPYAEPELAARVAALIRNRQMCERAELAEASVRAFLASSPDPLIGVDCDGRINYVGGAAFEAFGDATGDLRGRRVTEVLPELPVSRLSTEDSGRPPTTQRVPDLTIGGELFAPTMRTVGEG